MALWVEGWRRRGRQTLIPTCLRLCEVTQSVHEHASRHPRPSGRLSWEAAIESRAIFLGGHDYLKAVFDGCDTIFVHSAHMMAKQVNPNMSQRFSKYFVAVSAYEHTRRAFVR
jgi:hypothetical protein